MYIFRFLALLFFAAWLGVGCSKTIEQTAPPALYLSFKDDAGLPVSGAVVRLYKNESDTGLLQQTDTGGVVFFRDLEPINYYWLASKGCKTNRASQSTLGRALIPNAVLYGYSLLTETGVIKVISNAPETYNVSDTLLDTMVSRTLPLILYRRTGGHLFHIEKPGVAATRRDTLLRVSCSDTTILSVPF